MMTPIGLTQAFDDEWNCHRMAIVTVAARSRGGHGELFHGMVVDVTPSYVELYAGELRCVIPRDEIQAWEWHRGQGAAAIEQADNFAGYARWGVP